MDSTSQHDLLQEEMEVHADSAKKVFEIDLLRDMILKRVIWEKQIICRSTVNSIHLVQKSWLESVTKLLQNAKEPLFKLALTGRNSLNAHVGEGGKLLDQFVNAVASSSLSTGPSVPAFSVTMDEDVFLLENQESLSNMLVICGEGLVELNMEIPSCGGTLKYDFPGFRLPNLRKLTIDPNPVNISEEEEGPRTTDNLIHFIQSLLTTAPALTHFLVTESAYNIINPEHPLDFQPLSLPPSITALEFTSDMTRDHLGLLLKSQLPLLTSLTFLIPETNPLEDGLLFRILNKFRSTLNQLTLHYSNYRGPPRTVTRLSFPVMENLETFSNLTINCELAPEMTALKRFLPKVTRMKLTNQTPDMFRKWIRNSVLACVEQLVLHVVNDIVSVAYLDYRLGVDLEMMQGVHRTFPNVRKFDMSFRPTQVCGLKYLFMEMRQLTDLKICLVGNGAAFDWDSWGALLIGTPVDFMAGLRKSPDFWEQVQLTNEKSPSIKNLQELTSLCVNTGYGWGNFYPERKSLISDLAFHFAFLKMPNLKQLTLSNKFRPSCEMEKIWRGQGRSLV